MTMARITKVEPLLHEESPDVSIGVVVPHDFVLDRELWRFVPRNVQLHITRTRYLDIDVTAAAAARVSDIGVVVAAVQQLRGAAPAVTTYACTSGSYIRGVAGESTLRAEMEVAGACKASTTSGAMLQALRELEICRVAVATPYDADLTQRLEAFLREGGVEVASTSYLGLRRGIFRVTSDTVANLVVKADSPSAEAVFVSCTNLRTFDVISELEKKLGKPVLTANQVTMWAALRLADVQPARVPHRLFGPSTIPEGPGR